MDLLIATTNGVVGRSASIAWAARKTEGLMELLIAAGRWCGGAKCSDDSGSDIVLRILQGRETQKD